MRTCNITQNYVEKYDPWLGILASESFAILSTTNGLKDYIMFRLVFFCDVILLIKNEVDW